MLKRLYRILRRVFFYSLFTLIVIASAGMLSLWFYGDEIKSRIIRSFNETINTPINVSSVDIDATSYFPFVTIRFTKVDIKESYKFSENSLLIAETIECRLNPLNLIRGDYSIHSVIISDATANLKVNRRGEINYQITKSGQEGEEGRTSFSINKFLFRNVKMTWDHIPRKQYFDLSSEKIDASLAQGDTSLIISLEGLLDVYKMRFDQNVFLEGRSFETKAELNYSNESGRIQVKDGLLSLQEADFLVNGYYNPADEGNVDLRMEGTNTSIQNLLQLLPSYVNESLLAYKSDGNVYFSLSLTGRMSATEFPAISSNFGITDATITYPETGKKVTKVNLEGSYLSESITDLRTAVLSLRNFSGVLDERPFKGSLTIRNFTDKQVKLKLNGSFELPSLLSFIPQDIISESKGEVDLDINFTGRLKDLEKLSTINRISSDGQINLSNVSFGLSGITQSLNELNGSFLFNQNTIALQEFSGKFGQSDFLLNGVASNILSWILMDNQPLRLNASLNSQFIDVNELLAAREGEKAGKYSLVFSPLIDLEFNCQVGRVDFRRFSGENLGGVFKIKDQLAMFQKIQFEEVGGRVRLEGLVDTKGSTVDVLTRFTTENIHIDSMFYVFDDFGQDFLVSSHLKGRVNTDVNAEMKFTSDLLFIPQSLVADMNLQITRGELNNFAPIQELSRFVPDDSLAYLRFSNLENEIHIENRVIYIPNMEVRSNVTNISIGGTYTFDHHINFKLVAPVLHMKKKDRDEVFGAIEDDGTGVPKIHLLLTGTADDYIVSLDKTAMKNQLVTSLKQEVQELKDAFKKKREDKKKTLVLDEEEFFDWEDY